VSNTVPFHHHVALRENMSILTIFYNFERIGNQKPLIGNQIEFSMHFHAMSCNQQVATDGFKGHSPCVATQFVKPYSKRELVVRPREGPAMKLSTNIYYSLKA
jgi:hypothetical protein